MEEVIDGWCLRKESTSGTEVTAYPKTLLRKTVRKNPDRTPERCFPFYTIIMNGKQDISGDGDVENNCLL